MIPAVPLQICRQVHIPLGVGGHTASEIVPCKICRNQQISVLQLRHLAVIRPIQLDNVAFVQCTGAAGVNRKAASHSLDQRIDQLAVLRIGILQLLIAEFVHTGGIGMVNRLVICYVTHFCQF